MLLKNYPLQCWCTEVGVADFHDSEVHIKSLKWLRNAACVTHRLERVCKQLTTVPHQELCRCVTRGWAKNARAYQVTCQLCWCLPLMVMHNASVLYLLVPEPAWCPSCPPCPALCETSLAKEPAFGVL